MHARARDVTLVKSVKIRLQLDDIDIWESIDVAKTKQIWIYAELSAIIHK